MKHGARVDRVSVEVHEAFARAGIPGILLKGPSIAAWLYGPDELRPYGDSDFLIRRADWETAGDILQSLGFSPQWSDMDHPGLGSYSSFAFKRGDDAVDVHATLSGLDAGHDLVWDVLTDSLATQRVLHTDLPVLRPAAHLPRQPAHLRARSYLAASSSA